MASWAWARIDRVSSWASTAPFFTTWPRSTNVASTLPDAPAATLACSLPMSVPDKVRTRGTLISEAVASFTSSTGTGSMAVRVWPAAALHPVELAAAARRASARKEEKKE